MNGDSADFGARLGRSLCESFHVREDGEGRWAIRSPLLLDDGDALPVFVVRASTGEWHLTDDGMALSHLFFDEFNYTEPRFARLARLVEGHGYELTAENVINTSDGPEPDAFDVGDFLQLLAQVRGVALTSIPERDSTRYVTSVRQGVEDLLQTPDFDENWSPPELRERTRATYRADLRVATSVAGRDLVLFAASTSDKANVSALTVGHFKRVRSDLVPLLAYDPDRVASEAVYRFQDEVEDDRSIVAVRPGALSTLVAELDRRGVLISAGPLGNE